MQRILALAAFAFILTCPALADPPPAAAPTSTSTDTAAPPHPTGVRWVEQPGPADFTANYPRHALHHDISGHVVLDCLVNGDGTLDCSVIEEEPLNEHFGDASLVVARKFRIAQYTEDG